MPFGKVWSRTWCGQTHRFSVGVFRALRETKGEALRGVDQSGEYMRVYVTQHPPVCQRATHLHVRMGEVR